MSSDNNGWSENAQGDSPKQDHAALNLRSLVSSREAGSIIGKAGASVARLRESTGVRAGVSKSVPGVQDRIVTVSGPVPAVAQAYKMIAESLIEGQTGASMSETSGPVTASPSTNSTSIRLLISHALMGSIIGKAGAKIKSIQDNSGARMVAHKEMLPQSTERVVEIQGSPDAIQTAVNEIGECLMEDHERGQGTIPYHPGSVEGTAGVLAQGGMLASTVHSRRTSGGNRSYDSSTHTRTTTNGSTESGQNGEGGEERTQSISIPADMVGCIIGKGGQRINQVRRDSGARISIAKEAHDETGERMFTIVGSPEHLEKALYLLYAQLEDERERRLKAESANDAGTEA